MKPKQTHKTLATAGTVTAGLAATAAAATVQFTLTGNMVSSLGGNQLYADLTGDGTDDITIGAVSFFPWRVLAPVNGQFLYAWYSSSSVSYRVDAAFAGGFGDGFENSETPTAITFFNGITFTDARINNGQATNGYLEVTASSGFRNQQSIVLSRLIFDDTNPDAIMNSAAASYPEAIPEPSSLALLALGAGGILARRRHPLSA